MPDTEFDSMMYVLRPGDTMMIYTDGLTEAMSASRKMLGVERVISAVSAGPSQAKELLESALLEQDRHVGGAEQSDDTTIVCVGLDLQVEEEQTNIEQPPLRITGRS
jgi:sigma-B regulation protein RsbU (phosphoserine phosphatase)